MNQKPNDSLTFTEVLKSDFPSSIVVFLVALPLCMGIAIASGAPPIAGLITGIIGGLVVGFLAGSPLQVSGPAAGLAVIVFELVARYKRDLLATDPGASEQQLLAYALSMLAVTILIAGIVQLTAGLMRLGQWFRAVSPAVIQGMLAGIGALIFVSQFHVMVDDRPRGSGLANLLALPEAIYKGVTPANGLTVHHYAAFIGLTTIGVIVAWSFAPRRLKVLPAPLVAVLVATAITLGFQLPIEKVSVPENALSAVALPSSEAFARMFEWPVLLAGLALALVASAETLLCATAVDQLHQGPRTKYDRELAAQGVGNILAGLLGGLPMTGVIVRSSANVHAGARTRASAILHGLWLLLFVAMLPGVLRLIPISSLAAVLVYTGYKLMNPKAVRNLWKFGKAEVAIYAATVAVIVGKDLLTGVLVGIGLSIARLLYTFSHLSIRTEERVDQARTDVYLTGAATFIRLPQLAAALEKIPASAELHVHLDELNYIDHACVELLMNWERQHHATGGRLVIDWGVLTARFRRPAVGAAGGNGHTELPAVPLAAEGRRTATEKV